MKDFFKEFLKFAALPLLFLLLGLTFWGTWKFFDLPNTEELIVKIREFYREHGYWFVFVGALVEGLLFVNWYLPGSLVIVFGVVFTQGNPIAAVITVGLVILAFFITSLLNYAMGRYGLYHLFVKFGLREPLNNMRAKLERSGLAIIFNTYFHPNVGALTATSAGILQLSFYKFVFYSAIALIAWNTLWGFITYFSGPILLEAFHPKIAFPVLLIWIFVSYIQFRKNKYKKLEVLP